jgi:hypothetical protein
MNLYSPPTGGYPQELPDYWKFSNGEIRTDLRLLSSTDLASLDWIGPIFIPHSFTEKLDENGEPVLDENGNPVLEGEFDAETHKAVWYKAQRKFIIIEKHIDETPYINGESVNETTGNITNWNGFRIAMVSSVSLNSFIASAMLVAPIPCIALPAIISNIENDDYEKFEATWNAIVSAVDEVPVEVIQEFSVAAQLYSLPKRFIDLIVK